MATLGLHKTKKQKQNGEIMLAALSQVSPKALELGRIVTSQPQSYIGLSREEDRV